MPAKALGTLNASLFDLVESFPRATWELVDYHFKSAYDAYLQALHLSSQRQVAVFANDLPELERLIRRLLLVADTVVFNVAAYSEKPAISVFPIPDSAASPVLGVAPTLDHETGRPRFPKPVEVAYMLTMSAAVSETRGPDAVLGYEWGRGASVWQRSSFTRTSEPYQNDRGEDCHIAVGLGCRYEPPIYQWICGQARALMIHGSLAFAPFVRVTPDAVTADEGVMKSRLLGATFTTSGRDIRFAGGESHPIVTLDVPYIDNIPISLLAEVLADESESLQAFRRAMDRMIEDMDSASNPAAALGELRRLKRDLFEDELAHLTETCHRITRMRSLASVGAAVSTGAITLAAIVGLAVPGVIMGAAGGLTTTLAELWHTYEEKRHIRKSPVYWLWKLGQCQRK